MKAKCTELLRVMSEQNDWVTAGFLSGKLNVSERSVINYIGEINFYEKGVISSSRKGYLLDAEKAEKLLKSEEGKIPQTSKERVNFIITEILKNDANGNVTTDLYQIAEELFVSFETVKKDMGKVKRKLQEFELFLSSTNSCLSLEGKEQDKRKILSNLLYEEFNHNVMSLEIIEQAFPGYDLKILKSIIEEQGKQYHYFINQYALLSLVLDIVIGMDRMKKERTFGKSRVDGNQFGIREQELAGKIAEEIEKNFQVVFSSIEIEELTIILMSHLMKIDFAKIDSSNIENVVGRNCILIVEELMYLLKNTYFIDTNNQDFIIKFTLHIKNLLMRLENGYTTKNPLLEHIKNTCPLIFECALEVANRLKEITNYDIEEDEIAYIALHIGGNLETQKSKKKLISCMILFPQYYDFSNRMLTKLTDHFGERLEIKTVITSIDEVKNLEKEDLIISTIPVYGTLRMEWVMVTPFLNDRDFENIEDRMQKIYLRKIRARLKKNLMQISNPQFFYKNLDFESKENAIRFMTDIMEKEGYVDATYYSEILDRESQASTAFGHIAVPHSMKMNAKQTGMFVLINEKKPVEWDKNQVSIILLFAINKEDRAIFHDVYDNLIVLLLEQANAFNVMNCTTYIDFIEEVVNCFH